MDLAEWTRWIMGGAFLVMGCIPILGNWQVIIRRGGSFVPFFGGALATLGGAVLPLDGVWRFCWIALLLDPGCGYVLVLWALRKRRGEDNRQPPTRE